MTKNNKILTTLCVLALSATAVVGGTMAYLTDADNVSNKFTIGKVAIELTEPEWTEDENQQLEAGVTVKKDPTVTNTGINDAYVYLQVQIPKRSVITTDDSGVRQNNGEAVNQALFTFQANHGWTLMEKTELADSVTFTYSYDQILSPEQSTVPLFDTVTLVNVIEGQLDAQTFQIPVKAFAIQTANTGDGSGNIPSEAHAAYQKYLHQNSN